MFSPILASLCLFATSSPPFDAVRQTLSSHSDRMFLWLVISSIVTSLGVILEAPGEFHELGRWWKIRRAKKKVSWRVPVTFLGLVIVVAGIVGEGIFEFLSSDAETAIRQHDEGLLEDAIKDAGTAHASADAAVKAASRAQSIADNADLTARAAGIAAAAAKRDSDGASKAALTAVGAVSRVEAKADEIRKEEDSLDSEERGLTSRIIDTDARQRRSTELIESNLDSINHFVMYSGIRAANPETLSTGLKNFPKRRVQILYRPNDDEAKIYATDLYAGLKRAEWIASIRPFELHEKLCGEDLSEEQSTSVFAHDEGDITGPEKPSFMNAVTRSGELSGNFKGRSCPEVPDGNIVIAIPIRGIP